MSDDLDDLKRALDAATPAPDAQAKVRAVARAMTAFDAVHGARQEDFQPARQGLAAEARQSSDRPKTGPVRGVFEMLVKPLSNRAVLTAGTALAALGLVALVPVLQNMPSPDLRVTEVDAAPLQATREERPGAALGKAIRPQGDGAADHADAFEGAILADEPPVAPEISRPVPIPEPGRMATRKAAPQVMMDQSHAVPMMAPSGAQQTEMFGQPIGQAEHTESYPEAAPNPLKVTAEDPVSTFSIDVDTASWSIIRNSLMAGQLPPEGAVRIEEMVNYFPYDYPAPDGEAPFRASLGMMESPWRAGTQIVHIGLQGALPAARQPLNLVFLIDTSGSMSQPGKLPLLKQSFRLMLGQLRAEDSVSIVTYAGSAGRVLEPTSAAETETILAALENLQAGGGTAGQAGLQQAYATAAEMAQDGEVSRVILATDGDFNIGISDPEALEDYIARQRESGTYLSVLGFGRGNLDDATMQALAQAGNGMAAYIDTLSEAQKVLVDQLSGALFPIADDVKIQVEWNPSLVAEYRLIGYETRALSRADFNNDRVDAGEIGAGHQVTALYEITPVGSAARLTEPLRYGGATRSESGELGHLRLRYKAPGATESQLIEAPIVPGMGAMTDAAFALAIAGFGQLLQGSDLIGDLDYDAVIAQARAARGADPYGYRQEAINLMRLAQGLDR